MFDIDALVAAYNCYLKVVTLRESNGATGALRSFAEFIGVDGDGPTGQEFWQSVIGDSRLAVGVGQRACLLLDSGASRRDGGPSIGVTGVPESSVPDPVVPPVSVRTLANRAKRQRKVAAKVRKRGGGVTSESGGGSMVASDKVSVTEEPKSSGVPEWRRQDVRAKYHRGAFADCSEDVQRELRESRAKMLVEKNKAAVVEAEHKRRTMEARLKTRIVEAEAEKKRLTLAAENKKLVEARLAALPRGYAETVVSMGLESVADVPSLSSGSVSPDSSISVAELDRMKAAMEKLITRVAELEVQAEDHANEKEAAKKQKQQRPVVRGMFEPTDYERERALYSRWD